MLACGMDAKGVMAELTGRRGGYSKGKGGSMHMFSREKNFYGGHGIVGAQVPLGTGLAFAHRYRERRQASACTYLGDGAVNQGQVYESFNMAALWKLPVVYVIENNKYGMGTSVERASARHRALSARRRPTAFPASRSTAWTCWRCEAAADKALAHARGGKGPYILEMKTYRYRGHSMSDPGEVPQQGRSREDAPGARPDRRAARTTCAKAAMPTRPALKDIDREIKDDRAPRPPSSPKQSRSPIRPSSGPTCWSRREQAEATRRCADACKF